MTKGRPTASDGAAPVRATGKDAWQQVTDRTIRSAEEAGLVAAGARFPLMLGPGGPPFPPRPIPPGSSAVPDFGAQFAECLDAGQISALSDQVRQALGRNAEIRTFCIDGDQKLGAWLQPTSDPHLGKARDLGVRQLSLLDGGLFGFFAAEHLISLSAQQDFAARSPAPAGTRLLSLTVSLQAPDTVTTIVHGREDLTLPGANFDVTVVETLSVSGGMVIATPSARFDADLAAMLALAFLGLAGNPYWTLAAIFTGIQGAPAGITGVAGALLPLLPRQILTARGKRLFMYENVTVVDEFGITVSGVVSAEVPRDPSVTINGPQWIPVIIGRKTASATYTFTASEFNPDSVLWEADGNVAAPSSAATTIRFTVPADAQIGDEYSHSVRLTATDTSLGLTAPTATQPVTVFVTDFEPRPQHGPPHPPRGQVPEVT